MCSPGEIDGDSVEKRGFRGDGRVINSVISVSAVRRRDRSVEYFVALLDDVTKRKRAEEALRATAEQLQEPDRRKDKFLAVLAHELRNPLAPLRTGLELIRLSGSTTASGERVRAVMERQVGHMVRLINRTPLRDASNCVETVGSKPATNIYAYGVTSRGTRKP